jgi:Putative mono-oxygenase ydhR
MGATQMAVVLEINFVNDVSEEELAAATDLDAAKKIAAFPGLLWKVWIRDPRTRETGGVYLFESRTQAEAWVAGPTIQSIPRSEKVSNFSTKIFDIREEPSRITRAPIDVLVGAASR